MSTPAAPAAGPLAVAGQLLTADLYALLGLQRDWPLGAGLHTLRKDDSSGGQPGAAAAGGEVSPADSLSGALLGTELTNLDEADAQQLVHQGRTGSMACAAARRVSWDMNIFTKPLSRRLKPSQGANGVTEGDSEGECALPPLDRITVEEVSNKARPDRSPSLGSLRSTTDLDPEISPDDMDEATSVIGSYGHIQ